MGNNAIMRLSIHTNLGKTCLGNKSWYGVAYLPVFSVVFWSTEDPTVVPGRLEICHDCDDRGS